MNREALERSVFRDFGYADTPATAVLNRVRAYLNDRHRRLISAPGLEALRFQSQPFTLTASLDVYAFTWPIYKILQIADTTNDHVLLPRTRHWWRTIDPDPTAGTGTQEYWVPLGRSPQILKFLGTGNTEASTGLWVVSTSTADTTQTVKVETIDTNGSLTSTTAALNGTTRVQIGTATNHRRLTDVAIDAVGAGVISLYNAATGGDEVSRIGLGFTNADHPHVALWPTPAAADVIRIDYMSAVRDFTTAYDEPELPADWHWLVAVGAKIDEAHHKDDKRVRIYQDEYDKGLKDLVFFVADLSGHVPVPGDRVASPRSNLGSAFPAGLW